MVLRDITILRAWREHLGLTVEDVAAKLDLSPRVYQQFEEAEELPQSTRELIAEALGILPDQLDV